MSSNYQLDRDLKEAAAMARALKDYVRGDQLYGNAGGGFFSKMPSLTIGALLMRLRRLHELRGDMDSAQLESFREAEQAHHQVRTEWSTHYDEKLTQEAHSRLDAMRDFFRECAENPRLCANVYRPEALRRTIVEELLPELEDRRLKDDELTRKLRDTDGKLRGVVAPTAFIWDPVLKPVYPAQQYWWLYTQPPVPDASS